jgi:hypothetical protein
VINRETPRLTALVDLDLDPARAGRRDRRSAAGRCARSTCKVDVDEGVDVYVGRSRQGAGDNVKVNVDVDDPLRSDRPDDDHVLAPTTLSSTTW